MLQISVSLILLSLIFSHVTRPGMPFTKGQVKKPKTCVNSVINIV